MRVSARMCACTRLSLLSFLPHPCCHHIFRGMRETWLPLARHPGQCTVWSHLSSPAAWSAARSTTPDTWKTFIFSQPFQNPLVNYRLRP